MLGTLVERCEDIPKDPPLSNPPLRAGQPVTIIAARMAIGPRPCALTGRNIGRAATFRPSAEDGYFHSTQLAHEVGTALRTNPENWSMDSQFVSAKRPALS